MNIAASSSKGWNILCWVLQIALACLFLFAGASKLLGAEEMVNFFDQVGFGQWLRYCIGVMEVAGSVALLLPGQAFYGAIILSASLAVHVIVHAAVLHRPAGFLWLLLGTSLLIAFLRRPSSRRMAARTL